MKFIYSYCLDVEVYPACISKTKLTTDQLSLWLDLKIRFLFPSFTWV